MKDASKSSKPVEDQKVPEPQIIRFFISLPNNLFMELEERPNTTIRNIASQAMNVIVADPNFESTLQLSDEDGLPANSHSVPLKIFCKGKLLSSDSSLDYCGIRPGDTLVASFANTSKAPSKLSRKEPKAPKKEVKEVVATPGDSESKLVMEALSDMLNRQMKTMEQFTQEVR